MLGLLLAATIASSGTTPPATLTGFSPVLRFEGVMHDATVLAPSAEEVTVAPNWSTDDGVHVSLVGSGERVDRTLPGCSYHGCWRSRDGALIVTDPGGIRGEQFIQSRVPGAADPRWSTSVGPSHVIDLVAAAQGVQVLRAPEGSARPDALIGLDADGAVAWRQAAPSDVLTWLDFGEDEVLMFTPDQVHVIDAVTGVTHDVIDVPGGEVQLAQVTPTALLVSRGRRRPRLLRLERSGGPPVWTTSTPPLRVVRLVEDVLLTCTRGDELVARRLSDGRRLWSYGLGFDCHEIWRVPDRPGQPLRVLAGGRNGKFVLFEADPSPAPAERYTVRGRVIVDRRPQRRVLVHVGDRSVRTDDEGRYRVRARGRGIVRIWVDLPMSPRPGRVLNFEPEQTVELSGKRSYRRDLVTHTVYEDE